ncbi:MAG: V-type ATP synthase subunit E family protein [Candidatus Micrarchaeia archaeon]
MGLEELKQGILRKAEEEAQAIRRKAEAEAREIVSQAEKRREEAMEAARREANETLEREKRERLSTARLESRLILAAAREEMLSAVEEEIWKELAAFRKKKEYAGFLERAIRAGVREIGENAVVFVCKDDHQLAKKIISEKKIPAALSPKPVDVLGGAIVASEDGRVRCDASFAALMNNAREEIRKLVFASLFGQ